MHPVLFEIAGWPVYSYGVLLAAAYLAGLQMAVVRARHAGLDGAKVMDFGIYLIIAALVGAKLALVIVDFSYYRANPREILSLARAGGVFYGGLVAALVVGLLLVKRYRLPVWKTGDLIAPGVALGHVIGRMGCLMAGCCYGRPTTVPWAITFHNPLASLNLGTPLDVPLHPRQMYHAGAELILLIALLTTEKRGKPFAGRTFWLYMLLYAISRYIIEIYRGDERGIFFSTFSTSQLVSIVIVPVSVFMLWRLHKRAA
jgi:phosphatidylglycerol:prolipoprotein diacylglycerol transferase